ncbi:hypothetical protein OAN307_c18180 [Octadecabacter antarcticus 307]|uniref:Uncharacterized protein n=1 Tax=Octadecabacter antarcticus 307 TaxID=391626 RepID=M9RAW6_9RHOB|nr:hypothetical protein [Octadecabacter antarcticus]AGI67476.1 hypothetical protein OAN307_c18180 [Octadecabacter antarcticus 307]
MHQAKQNSGAARTATGADHAKAAGFSRQEKLESKRNVVAGFIDSLPASARYRHEKRVTAVIGLDNLGLDDALVICATYIDQHCAGDPPYDAFGNIRESAAWWADLANPVELQCYFAAALKRLEYQALGIKARKRMFTVLWLAFTNTDRQAFLARVDVKGNFYRKGAA